ncbi:hypothetical protein GCM10027058_30270 [Microbacterium neimengense]
MVEAVVIGYVACVTAVIAVVWRRGRSGAEDTRSLSPLVRRLLRSARRRALAAIVVAGGVVVGLSAASFSAPQLVGLPILLAPAVGAISGLVLYAVIPPRAGDAGPDSPREASLTPRTPLSHTGRRGIGLLVFIVVAQSLFVLFAGLTSSADERGRERTIAFDTAEYATAASPYPGWFYGVPLLVATAMLVLSTFLALRRVSSTPALGERRLADVDASWRRETAQIILLVALSAVLLPLGGVALQAGLSIGRAYVLGVGVAWIVAATILAVVGVLVSACSVVAVIMAARRAILLPVSVAAEAGDRPASARGKAAR